MKIKGSKELWIVIFSDSKKTIEDHIKWTYSAAGAFSPYPLSQFPGQNHQNGKQP